VFICGYFPPTKSPNILPLAPSPLGPLVPWSLRPLIPRLWTLDLGLWTPNPSRFARANPPAPVLQNQQIHKIFIPLPHNHLHPFRTAAGDLCARKSRPSPIYRGSVFLSPLPPCGRGLGEGGRVAGVSAAYPCPTLSNAGCHGRLARQCVSRRACPGASDAPTTRYSAFVTRHSAFVTRHSTFPHKPSAVLRARSPCTSALNFRG